MERNIASIMSKVLGIVTTRTPLSGINSGHGPGDIICPPGYDFLAEAKYRASFMHHGLYWDAVADAAKHGVNQRNVMLWTKVKREQGMLVTISDELFEALLEAGGKELLKANPSSKT